MSTDYNQIAAEYKKAKRQPWRMHVEHYTLFDLLGDLTGKAVLDLACGEGFYSRFLKLRGASRVVGVDLSEEMIRLAREEERRQPLGVEYHVGDGRHLDLGERFDVVVAAFLLNYARTAAELLEMAEVIAHSLRPGGRFVTVNNNPAQSLHSFNAARPFGFTKWVEGEVNGVVPEGAPIHFVIYLDDGPLEIINYHLSPATHEWALTTAGLVDIRWHAPRLSPAGEREYGRAYWDAFLTDPAITFLECRKP